MEKFIELRKMALPKYHNQFKLEITPKDANEDWGYQLKVGDFTLYNCDKVFEKTRSIDERDQLANFHVKNISMKLEEALSVENHDIQQLLNFTIRCLAGSEKEQNSLREKLDDRAYSKDNYLGIKNSNKPNELIAAFKNNKQLVFSIRTGELENNFLKNTLASKEYNNLREMFFNQYTSISDPLFIDILQQTKADVYDVITQDSAYLSEQERAIVNEKLSAIKIGDKTLAELWALPLNGLGEYIDDDLNPAAINYFLNHKAAGVKFYNLELNAANSAFEFDEPELQFDDAEFEFAKSEVEFSDLESQADDLASDFDEIMADKPLFEQSPSNLNTNRTDSGYESDAESIYEYEGLFAKDYKINKKQYSFTSVK
ncbi:hypothetical protein [Arsenophonus nasoniae]|uniref:Uncharacterized protein n=1 Tax=Arsenophonus nasoniae TaxID=638 RepID=A0AA95GBV9_9GAMM|nr:hypothetical protein [Arsenophonus nasoniae]WGL95392.1 hypothetical protein QE207_17425 [Arsenophonus nasoniae]